MQDMAPLLAPFPLRGRLLVNKSPSVECGTVDAVLRQVYGQAALHPVARSSWLC